MSKIIFVILLMIFLYNSFHVVGSGNKTTTIIIPWIGEPHLVDDGWHFTPGTTVTYKNEKVIDFKSTVD